MDSEKIDHFLLGKLSEEENSSFQKKLETSQLLQEQVNERKALLSVIELNYLHEITAKAGKEALKEIRRDKHFNLTRLSMQIAASVVLLSVLGLSWMYFFLQPADLASHIKPYELVYRTGENESGQLTAVFESGNYQKFLKLFKEKSPQTTAKETFYAGLAYLQIGNSAAAELTWKSQIESTDSPSEWYYHARWQLMGLHLQNTEVEKAQLIEEAILNDPKDPYRSEMDFSFSFQLSAWSLRKSVFGF